MALEKTEIGLRKEFIRKCVFTSHDPGKMSEPPQESKSFSKPRSKILGNRVHYVDDDYADDP